MSAKNRDEEKAVKKNGESVSAPAAYEMRTEGRAGAWHLEALRIDSFGGFFNKTIGPFEPGMNIVYGKNESGKTTTTAFIKGLLFGWPRSVKGQNAYKPVSAERSGRLLFANGEGATAELKRVGQVKDLAGDVALVDDIEEETFSTMFALDSDELRSLSDTDAVTARLLTAGSGTGESPAKALADLEMRLKEYLSTAAEKENSIANLKARLRQVEQELQQAEEEAQQLCDEEGEYKALGPAREALSKAQREANERIEQLKARRSAVEMFDAQLKQVDERRQEAQDERLNLKREAEARAAARTRSAAGFAAANANGAVGPETLSPAEENRLRDDIDGLQRDRDRLESAVVSTRQAWVDSRATYQTLLEAGEHREGAASARGQKTLQWVLALVALAPGTGLFVLGWMNGTELLSYAGIGLMIAAFIFGAVALFGGSRGHGADGDLQAAEQVMMRDEKRLSICENDLQAHDAHIAACLSSCGLGEAGGSLARARDLLNEVRDRREADALLRQRQEAAQARGKEIEADAQRAQQSCNDLLREAGVESAEGFDELIEAETARRDEVIARAQEADNRYGVLAERLSAARHARDFDRLKQEGQLLQTRLKDSTYEYARLLLARRNLQRSIDAWESKSQPEVYQRASRLFSQMTNGCWRQVRLGPDGQPQVLDEMREARDPYLLSLGTCQQLYLSLRIALLMTATNVGRSLPILADDILVNFDAERREAAARALLELAEQRQVFFFTCHAEILELMEGLALHVNTVRL